MTAAGLEGFASDGMMIVVVYIVCLSFFEIEHELCQHGNGGNTDQYYFNPLTLAIENNMLGTLQTME